MHILAQKALVPCDPVLEDGGTSPPPLLPEQKVWKTVCFPVG